MMKGAEQMTKTEIKYEAQEELLYAMGVAFERVNDDISKTEKDREAIKVEMSKQMARVEQLFGIEPFSTVRGV